MLHLALLLQVVIGGSTSSLADTTCAGADTIVTEQSVHIGISVGSSPAPADSTKRDGGTSKRATRPEWDHSRRDSLRAVARAKEARKRCEKKRNGPRHLAVTPYFERTAFADAEARVLLTQARAARATQDSALHDYDAKSYQRISARLGFRKIGRDRLVFRTENASRVRWQRGVGAQVDLLGARSVIPIVTGIEGTGKKKTRQPMTEGAVEGGADPKVAEMLDEGMDEGISEMISPIPYYPGRDQLLPMINQGTLKLDADEDDIIHPLANGAEAYYIFATGDSATIRLGDGRAIRLKELVARARKPQWNVAIASLWFDVESLHLVRAVYRFSEPMDIKKVAEADDPESFEDVPFWVKPAIFPMQANVSALSVEYGLLRGRFWLPRTQALEGEAQVGFMHVGFEAQERFTYAGVNTGDTIAPIVRDLGTDSILSRIRHDSTLSDSAKRAMRRAVTDSVVRARRVARRASCDSTGTYLTTMSRYDGALQLAVRVPCDTTKLAHSSELPPSIYDSGDELFGDREMSALRDEVLGLRTQSAFAPQRPTFQYGLELTRYNRVEGISTGLASEWRLGAGYVARGEARIGTADHEPNGELRLARSDGRRTLALGAYHRLAVADDWGNPLGFGGSFNALLFGRDEGFYYRTTGVSLSAIGEGRSIFQYTLFAEKQNDARRETQWSLAHVLNGHRFDANIVAREGHLLGTAVHLAGSRGADPRGLRLFGDLRGEGGTGSFTFARLASDVTVSHGLGSWLDGALTLGGGSSVGELPVQRSWFLGGSQTVRGQAPGAEAGNAYWLGRAEVGYPFLAARPVLFTDLGWAGDRDAWRHPGRPLSGVGVGASFLDGLIRADIARGIYPSKATRADVMVEAKF